MEKNKSQLEIESKIKALKKQKKEYDMKYIDSPMKLQCLKLYDDEIKILKNKIKEIGGK